LPLIAPVRRSLTKQCTLVLCDSIDFWKRGHAGTPYRQNKKIDVDRYNVVNEGFAPEACTNILENKTN
jgi:hypothetical protein